MRNRIVHDYLGVDEDVVWEVVTGDLPPLVDHWSELSQQSKRDESFDTLSAVVYNGVTNLLNRGRSIG